MESFEPTPWSFPKTNEEVLLLRPSKTIAIWKQKNHFTTCVDCRYDNVCMKPAPSQTHTMKVNTRGNMLFGSHLTWRELCVRACVCVCGQCVWPERSISWKNKPNKTLQSQKRENENSGFLFKPDKDSMCACVNTMRKYWSYYVLFSSICENEIIAVISEMIKRQ